MKSAVLVVESFPKVHFLIDNVGFTKNDSILVVTKLKAPEIKINLPYEIFFINEIGMFVVDV